MYFFFFIFFVISSARQEKIVWQTWTDMDVRYACEKKAKKKKYLIWRWRRTNTNSTKKKSYYQQHGLIKPVAYFLSSFAHCANIKLSQKNVCHFIKNSWIVYVVDFFLLLSASHRLILVRIGCNVDLCCMCVCSVEHWPLIWDWSLITSHIFGQTYVWNCADCEKSSWNVICIHRFGLLVITKSMWYISKLMQYLKRA